MLPYLLNNFLQSHLQAIYEMMYHIPDVAHIDLFNDFRVVQNIFDLRK